MNNIIKEKYERQKAFFSRKDVSDILVYLSDSNTFELSMAGFVKALYNEILRSLMTEGSFPDEASVDNAVKEYLDSYREQVSKTDSIIPDDAIPTVYAHFDAGVITSAMCGIQVTVESNTLWCNPEMEWEQIDNLKFNPDDVWISLALNAFRALWKYWSEDFFTMPFIHRSPLDSAWGIRGNELFVEMTTDPDRVKKLLDWCVDWQLTTESFMYDNVQTCEGWGVGMMNTWSPDRGIWVNGDPVGIISREQMLEFEKPFIERLFKSTGGGHFHNHTLGIYQVDQVARIDGIVVQEFTKDPNCPTLEDALLHDPLMREKIIQASLITPIFAYNTDPTLLDKLLPIMKEGRFIIETNWEEYCLDRSEVLKKVRKYSNFK